MTKLPNLTVVVLRQEVLPLSETFILQQARSVKGLRIWLVGIFRSNPGLDPGEVNSLVLESRMPARLFRGLWSLLRRASLTDHILAATILRLRPDVVHVHFGLDAVRFRKVLSIIGKPVVVTLHGYDVTVSTDWWDSGNGGALNVGYHSRLRDLAAQSNVSFLAVSKAIQQKALAIGIPASKIRVEHIGVDVNYFRPSGLSIALRRPRVLFVGRLVPKKGLSLLLRAAAIVKRKLQQLEITVIGDGPEFSENVRLNNELDVGATFLGSQPASRIRTELELCRVFCLPSVTAENGDAEGLPIVLLEAQACGVPVITTAQGGMLEAVIDGVTGITFPERSVQDLANAIERLVTDDGFAERMSGAARDHIVKRFDLDHCSRRLKAVYVSASTS